MRRVEPDGSRKAVEEAMRLIEADEEELDERPIMAESEEVLAAGGGHAALPSGPSAALARPKSAILTPI